MLLTILPAPSPPSSSRLPQLAAHDAVLRKSEIRDKLGVMKSTQNFKGLKKLTSSLGFDLDEEEEAKGATGKAGGEPMSPTPKSP